MKKQLKYILFNLLLIFRNVVKFAFTIITMLAILALIMIVFFGEVAWQEFLIFAVWGLVFLLMIYYDKLLLKLQPEDMNIILDD